MIHSIMVEEKIVKARVETMESIKEMNRVEIFE
jgi:hypothetical protein